MESQSQNREIERVEFITFREDLVPAYVELNREWIERHFAIEEMDLKQLQDPKGNILSHGGEIFFVLENGEAVATCAMVPHGPGCYELAKMAVSPHKRGRGYGDLLMARAIQWAKANGANKVMLLSNTILTPAIALYHKHGFITTHLGPHPDYQRCNIEMELALV